MAIGCGPTPGTTQPPRGANQPGCTIAVAEMGSRLGRVTNGEKRLVDTQSLQLQAFAGLCLGKLNNRSGWRRTVRTSSVWYWVCSVSLRYLLEPGN